MKSALFLLMMLIFLSRLSTFFMFNLFTLQFDCNLLFDVGNAILSADDSSEVLVSSSSPALCPLCHSSVFACIKRSKIVKHMKFHDEHSFCCKGNFLTNIYSYFI